MHNRKLIALAGAAALALGTAGPAVAKKPHHGVTVKAPSKASTYTYWFEGTVAATPAAGSSQVAVNVTMANRGVHRFFKNHAGPITFTFGPSTSFVAVNPAPSGRGNVPSPTTSATLVAGHKIDVLINAPRDAKMASVLAVPAARITDRTNAVVPTGFNYTFRGTLKSVTFAPGGAAASLTMVIHRAYRPWGTSYGLNREVTFTIDPATLFVNWERNVPSLIMPSDIPAGQTVWARIRAPRGTRLATLLTQPLWRVAHFGPLPATATS